MSQKAAGLGSRSNRGASDQDRRWAILRWLSVKLGAAPHGEVLEAAKKFEEFVAARPPSRKPSREARSKIEKIRATARTIVASAAEAELEFEEMGALKLRKPNRMSRKPRRWLHKR